METAYIEWLRRRGTPLFENAGIHWWLYRGALIPATAAPCFTEVSSPESRRLLKESGAWILRYSSEPRAEPSAWWYVLCDQYDPRTLSSKTRSEINRGRRHSTIDRIEPEWLAEHGYACYRAAFGRYGDSQPLDEAAWREDILGSIGGPFEFWGVFVGSRLAGYCRCILEGPNVATSAIRLDPEQLKGRISYALLSHLLGHYVGEGGKTMSNGNRAVAHETQFQEFLLKHGFRKQYCRLNVVYRGVLRTAIRLMFPLRRAVMAMENRGAVERVKALLVQEEWRRSSHAPLPLP